MPFLQSSTRVTGKQSQVEHIQDTANLLPTFSRVVTRSAGNDVSALTASGSLLWDTGCSGGYDANGLCDQYYVSPTCGAVRISEIPLTA